MNDIEVVCIVGVCEYCSLRVYIMGMNITVHRKCTSIVHVHCSIHVHVRVYVCTCTCM